MRRRLSMSHVLYDLWQAWALPSERAVACTYSPGAR
ncbi:MAG: hypothetical protein ACI9MC_003405 [Kiritimatiellia bacterium]|jgi:hypothetical protein